MRQTQENVVSMWAVSLATLNKNQTLWATDTPFESQVARLSTQKTDIGVALTRQQQATKAYTANKEAAKTTAIETALIVAKNVEAYASIEGNALLKTIMHTTKSILHVMPDTELATKMQAIHDLSLTELPNMPTYANTTLSLAAFQTLINDYQAALTGPSEIIAEIKTATAQIEALITAGQTTLRILDMLMINYKSTQPQFYSDYRNSRPIKNLGSQKTKLQLFVELEDGVDASMIPIVITNQNGKNYTETTNPDGKATFSGISRGYYAVSITRAGYKPFELQNLKIQSGKTTPLSVFLEKE